MEARPAERIEVMTTSEVESYLRISRKTLLKLVSEGKLPARKIGKNYRYLKSEINNFLKGQTVNYFENN
ncbi:MAG: helix-turn-helix domain-containing protein [Bdellovibrio sp.]|nr:helix-turn-helix domain-containing protein [Bdellovibrio sp.]